MVCGIALAAFAISQRLPIETVRNMSYERTDHRIRLRRIQGTTPIFFQSKLSCNVDGSPNAYHPIDDRLSLDIIESADGKRRDDRPDSAIVVQPSAEIVVWVGGKPYVQPEGEFKGFFVSETTLQNPTMAAIDPHRYLDARHIQYIVLPASMAPEARVGDLAIVYDPFAKTLACAVFGDIGPVSESGEASLATLQRLGMAATDGKSSPGQLRDDLFFLVFPNTASRLQEAEPWPYRQGTIDTLASEELAKWGGIDRIKTILNQEPCGGSIPDTDSYQPIYDELASLKERALVRAFDFALPARCSGGSAGRLPCAPEMVVAAKAGVLAIEDLIGSAELSKIPRSRLNGMSDHLHRLSGIFRRFPTATSDVLEGVLRETTRCAALESRISALQLTHPRG